MNDQPTLTILRGNLASGQELTDCEILEARVNGGRHDGHIIHIVTSKFDCGAYGIDIVCDECITEWHNRMDGCWQRGHQRPEQGDRELAPLFDAAAALAERRVEL